MCLTHVRAMPLVSSTHLGNSFLRVVDVNAPNPAISLSKDVTCASIGPASKARTASVAAVVNFFTTIHATQVVLLPEHRLPTRRISLEITVANAARRFYAGTSLMSREQHANALEHWARNVWHAIFQPLGWRVSSVARASRSRMVSVFQAQCHQRQLRLNRVQRQCQLKHQRNNLQKSLHSDPQHLQPCCQRLLRHQGRHRCRALNHLDPRRAYQRRCVQLCLQQIDPQFRTAMATPTLLGVTR